MGKRSEHVKVLVCDKLSPEGVEILESDPDVQVILKAGITAEELLHEVADVEALIVRSRTRITPEVIAAAPKLRVIGRAGVGTDNVDVDAATSAGVLVINTPDANTLSTAEHTIALILALARKVAAADRSMRDGEWARAKFEGVEVYGKVLGVIGLGRIGSHVAQLARALGMKPIAYDPYVSKERAAELGVELVELNELLSRSDFVTLHVPKTSSTRHMIAESELAKMKPDARIINCARGGIIDERALYAALSTGRLAGAALDVYENEPPADSPLLRCQNCLLTPHLGAATVEASERVSVEIAEQALRALQGQMVPNAVNAPGIPHHLMDRLLPYADLCEKLGKLLVELTEGRADSVSITYAGPISAYDCEPLSAAFLKGIMEATSDQPINYVNARLLAEKRGIRLTEAKLAGAGDFANLITGDLRSGDKSQSAAGTLFAANDPRIVRIGNYHVDAVPAGQMLIITNRDRPGVIGDVGRVLGARSVNIAAMTCGRDKPGGVAVTVLNLDSQPTEDIVQDILELPNILMCKLVSFRKRQ